METQKHGYNWKGGRFTDVNRRTFVWMPKHPRSSGGYVQEHTLIAEKALGKFLPSNVVVHHIDSITKRNDMLVLCENNAYHLLLHKRARAFAACGHANHRHCYVCGRWLSELAFWKSKYICRKCDNRRSNNYYQKTRKYHISGFWDTVEKCKHKNLYEDYSVVVYCPTPYCSGSEDHCKDCGVYISDCGCHYCYGLSGWPESRQRRIRKKYIQTANPDDKGKVVNPDDRP